MSLVYRRIIRHGLRRGLRSRAGFSRREFLRRTVIAAAGLAVAPTLAQLVGCQSKGSGLSTTRTSDRAKGLRVVVVGAGFAGLTCADVLARNGAEVTVLEAGSRAGGRVQTTTRFIQGQKVEMGGEFFGQNHPTWLAYAKRFGLDLETLAEYDDTYPLIFDGKVVEAAEADQLFEEVDAALERIIELAAPIDPVRPWQSSGASDYDIAALADFIANAPISDQARRLMTLTAESDNGVPAHRMSMLGYLAMVKGGGLQDYFELSEMYRLRGGNDQLAKRLAASLGDRVILSSPVTRIERAPGRATVTAGERRYEADAVVLAVPPTQWTKIDLGHPVEQIPQMGSNVKCILRLRRPAWQGTGFAPEAVSDGLAQLTWVPTEQATRGPVGFTMFSGSETAEHWRRMPDRERPRAAIESLKAAYPELADATEASMFVDWPAMGRFGGSYSFPAPGQVTAMGPTLVDGLSDGNAPLLFAGEHTSYAFTGYMEGALSSGVRVAEQLIASRARA